MDQTLDVGNQAVSEYASPFLDALNIDCSSFEAFTSTIDPSFGLSSLRNLFNPSDIYEAYLTFANDLCIGVLAI